MEVEGIRWIGLETDRLPQMRASATTALGLRVAGERGTDLLELAVGDGARLELSGSVAAADGPWRFATSSVMSGL